MQTDTLPTTQPKHKKLTALVWAGGLLLLAGLFYLPTFFRDVTKPLSLVAWIFNNKSRFMYPAGYEYWIAVSGQINQFKVPLWDNVTQTPLIAASEFPILYPPSLVLFFGGTTGTLLFYIFHTWVYFCGIFLLIRYVRQNKNSLLALLAGFVVGSVEVVENFPTLTMYSLDWAAALAWFPLGIWLTLLARRYVKLLALSLVCGLILTATVPRVSVYIVSGLVAMLVIFDLVKHGFRGWWYRAILSAVVVYSIGFMLAGAQLFMRAEYNPLEIRRDTVLPLNQAYLKAYTEYSIGSAVVSDRNVLLLNGTPAKRPEGTFENVQILSSRQNSSTEIEYQIKAQKGTGAFFLVIPQPYASGWQGQLAKNINDSKGNEAPLYRANGQWRAILVDPSQAEGEILVVRARYNPLSFTMGIFSSFLGICTLVLGFIVLGWVRWYKEDESDHPLRKVAKNTVTPMFAQLVGKGIDLGFAFFSLRLLTPEGNGRYTLAVTTWLIFNTITDFGLETLVTREIAKNRSFINANRYFGTMLVTRTVLSLLALPLALLWIGGLNLTTDLASDTSWAIILLVVSLVPNTLAGTCSAVFRGYEKFEFTAAVQLLNAIIRVPVSLGVLVIGWGVIGLAGTAVLINIIVGVSLYVLMRGNVLKPEFKGFFEFKLAKQMLVISYPLMLNSLLVSLFFKADIFILYPFRGEFEVGIYNSAYKFIDGLLIIPSTLTIALFPLFSRYSEEESKERLMHAFREVLRLLTLISLPVSAGVLFVAYDLIGALGGSQYLPDGAIAFQILIWFLPFSYINGVTQYVLISINCQHLITWAVLATAISNIVLNLALIPFFGYIAAATTTIVSEIILIVVYDIVMRKHIGAIPLWYCLARPGGATLIMFVVLATLNWFFGVQNFFLNVLLGAVVYGVAVWLLQAVTKTDLRLVKKAFNRKA